MSKRYVVVLTETQRFAVLAALDNTYGDPSERANQTGYEAGLNARGVVSEAPRFEPIERAVRHLCGAVGAGETEPKEERAVAKLRAWLT